MLFCLMTRLARRVSSRKRRRHSSYRPISLDEFNSHYTRMRHTGELERQFQMLQEHSNELHETKSRDVGLHMDNKAKNRYVDIIPCEALREVMKNQDHLTRELDFHLHQSTTAWSS